ncbi:hypothetical protein CR513_49313, partial [Mucuna pruriens]
MALTTKGAKRRRMIGQQMIRVQRRGVSQPKAERRKNAAKSSSNIQKCFVRDFNTTVAPLNKIIKRNVGRTLRESLLNLEGKTIQYPRVGTPKLSQLNKRHAKWVEFVEQFPMSLNTNKERQMKQSFLGFVSLKDLYVNDDDFSFLFKEKRLYVPKSLIRELLVKEAHEGGLMGHFGVQKTNVHHMCERCLVCKMAKSKTSSHGLYTSLPILTIP